MAEAKARSEPKATISAKVIRADGTEEDLGVISATNADANKMAALIKELRSDEGGGPTLEEVNAQIEEESKRNQAETKRLGREAGD